MSQLRWSSLRNKNGLTQRKAAEASEGHITKTQPATVCQVLWLNTKTSRVQDQPKKPKNRTHLWGKSLIWNPNKWNWMTISLRRQKNSPRCSAGVAIVLASSALVQRCLKASQTTMCHDCAPTTSQSVRFHVAPSTPHSSLVSKPDFILLASYLCYTMGSNTQGQLGIDDPSLDQKCSPVLVDLLLNFKTL